MGKLGRSIVAMTLLGLVLAGGCGGSSQQAITAQAMTQRQAPNSSSELQNKLMVQTTQASLAGYKDYQIGPEDLLEILFLGLDDLNREVRVNGQGEITVPLVNAVNVAGLSPQQVEEKLMKLYREREFINNPHITVQVKEYRHQRVMVTGAVAQPGSYEVIGPRTLLEMLGKAGGLNDRAGDMVHLVRNQSAADRAKAAKGNAAESFAPGTETIVIDLRRLLMEGDLKLNLPVKSGDVVHVPFARSAFVLGAVNKPGNVPVKDNLTVTQALAVAGGLNPLLASNRVTVVRLDEKGQQVNMTMNMKDTVSGKEKDPIIRENDIVYAHESGFRRFLFNVRNLWPGALSVPLIP
ncbi:MAG: polysaccharide biosynthesis/export family protein [Deltaproteobacteria bacterium]|nr:polysaccharide biosynthesis/export family protein [Deltaproteobacteria bacterium]